MKSLDIRITLDLRLSVVAGFGSGFFSSGTGSGFCFYILRMISLGFRFFFLQFLYGFGSGTGSGFFQNPATTLLETMYAHVDRILGPESERGAFSYSTQPLFENNCQCSILFLFSQLGLRHMF